MKTFIIVANFAILTAQALAYGSLFYIVLNEAIDRRETSVLRQTCEQQIHVASQGQADPALVKAKCRAMVPN